MVKVEISGLSDDQKIKLTNNPSKSKDEVVIEGTTNTGSEYRIFTNIKGLEQFIAIAKSLVDEFNGSLTNSDNLQS